jgi:hypothetical protein
MGEGGCRILLVQLFSNAKTCFQSSFMLITVQLFFLASAISASLNVPMCDWALHYLKASN